MKERINLIAKGIIEYEVPELVIEPAEINEVLPAGLRSFRSIMVKSVNQVPVRGLIYVSGKHIHLIDRQMAGYRYQVDFEVAADEAKPGTVLEGKFFFVTNGAEFAVPYRYEIQSEEKTESVIEEAPEEEIPTAPALTDEQVQLEEQEKAPKEKYSLADHCVELLADYLCGRYDSRMILPSLDTELSIWKKNEPDSLWPDMLSAFLLLQKKRRNDAIRLLEAMYDEVMARRSTEIEAYSFYLYLRFELTGDEEQKETIYKLIVRFYREWSRTPILYLLILAMSDAWVEDPAPVLAEIRELEKQQSCVSLLRMQACRMLAECPEQITELGDYEIRLFTYGQRQKLVTAPMAVRIGLAAEQRREPSEEGFALLSDLYAAYPVREVLVGRMAMAVRCHKTDAELLPDYEKAIREDVRLNGLYECYLESLPEDYEGTLPEELLLYYSFKHELSDAQHEILYHHILRTNEPGSKVFRSYQEQMEQFAIRQLLNGRINAHLAPIYRELLFEEMVDERIAGLLPDLLYAKEIECGNAAMKRVIVRYPERVGQVVKKLEKSRVCIPVYTDSAVILFADAKGKIFRAPYTIRPLMENGELLERCREIAGDADAFRYLKLLDTMKKTELEAGDWETVYDAFRDASYEESFRREIAGRLLAAGEVFDSIPAFEHFLTEVDIAGQTKHDLMLYEDTLIRLEKYEMAMTAVKKYGYTGLRSERLEQLAQSMIVLLRSREDSDLMNICMSLYRRKKAEGVLLEYICRYYNGTTKEMLGVLKEAGSHQVNLADLPERLLAQMMFTGIYEEIDFVFAAYAGGEDVMKLLVQAYYALKCYQYFVKRETVPKYLFPYIEDFVRSGQCMPDALTLCGAALLEYYSTLEELSEEQTALAQAIADRMLERQIFFASFPKLARFISLPVAMNGKQILETRAGKNRTIVLEYVISPDSQTPERLEMKEMYDGVYVRGITLFEGEWMTCRYVDETDGGRTVLTEDMIVRPEFHFRIPGSRFDLICQLAAKGRSGAGCEEILKEMEKKDMVMQWLLPIS